MNISGETRKTEIGREMYKVGDRVVHPMHGAGTIIKVEESRVPGKNCRYYVFRTSAGAMTVAFPVDSCELIGVRPVCRPEESDEVLRKITQIDVETETNWNRRYRDNMEKLKSGDMELVGYVVKELTLRGNARALSTSERKMLHLARQILVSELVMSKGISYEEGERALDAAVSGEE